MSADTPPEKTSSCHVVVCRGCCCGTDKHPDVDHAAQLQCIRQVRHASVRVSGCLGDCDNSNNIVVVPSRAGRAAGATPVWLARILDPELTEAIAGWLDAGGPGLAPMPRELAAHRLTARGRREASEV
ncbi:MAG: (2Fe-2S) ferredoxin domain-containing protein [Hamadaea sp.]|nr:(2Fe-2S) ferredoxin domain-containing protein [Hamadaea sp.]